MNPHNVYHPTLAQQLNAQQAHTPDHYNRFPDHRGVFDGNQRTLWQHGGKEARPYENPFAQDIEPAHRTPAGGHYLPRKLTAQAPHAEASFRPFEYEKLKV